MAATAKKERLGDNRFRKKKATKSRRPRPDGYQRRTRSRGQGKP